MERYISPVLTYWRKHLFAFLLALVGTSGLDMARLLALITHTLALCFSWAIAGNMTDFATVVAFLSLSAVTGHVAIPTAGIACLLATAKPSTPIPTTTVSTAVSASLGAVARNVSNLATFVALLASRSAREASTVAVVISGSSRWAVT